MQFNDLTFDINSALRDGNHDLFCKLCKELTPKQRDRHRFLIPVLKYGDKSIFCCYLEQFSVISLKGFEMTLCSYAKKFHYQLMFEKDICFSLQDALKYTLIYRKYGCFQYLLKKIKFKEQIDHVYLVANLPVQTTLLAMAAIQGYHVGVTKILETGADLNGFVITENRVVMNYLMYICSNLNYQTETNYRKSQIINTIKLLINKGIDINHQGNEGQTALMIAASCGNRDLVKLLLEYGANTKIIDMSRKKAIDYASDESIRKLIHQNMV